MNLTLKLFDGRIRVRVNDQHWTNEPRLPLGDPHGGRWTAGGGGGGGAGGAGGAKTQTATSMQTEGQREAEQWIVGGQKVMRALAERRSPGEVAGGLTTWAPGPETPLADEAVEALRRETGLPQTGDPLASETRSSEVGAQTKTEVRRIKVPATPGEPDEVEVLVNPTYYEVMDLAKQAKYNFVRLMTGVKGEVYAWDSDAAVHAQVVQGLGIGEEHYKDIINAEVKLDKGKLFEAAEGQPYLDEDDKQVPVRSTEKWFRKPVRGERSVFSSKTRKLVSIAPAPRPEATPEVQEFGRQFEKRLDRHSIRKAGDLNIAHEFQGPMLDLLDDLGEKCPLGRDITIQTERPWWQDDDEQWKRAQAGVYAQVDAGAMWINPSIYADAAKAKKLMAADRATDYHDGITDPVANVSHEYAHALHDSISEMLDPKLKVRTRDLGEVKLGDALERLVILYSAANFATHYGVGSLAQAIVPSMYGLTNPDEFWAEAFAVSRYGKGEFKGREAVRLVSDIVAGAAPHLAAIRDGRAKVHRPPRAQITAMSGRTSLRPAETLAVLQGLEKKLKPDERSGYLEMISALTEMVRTAKGKKAG